MVGVVGRGTNLLSNNKILSPYYSLYMSYYKSLILYRMYLNPNGRFTAKFLFENFLGILRIKPHY